MVLLSLLCRCPSYVAELDRLYPGVVVNGVLQGSTHKLRSELEQRLLRSTGVALASYVLECDQPWMSTNDPRQGTGLQRFLLLDTTLPRLL